MNKAAKILIVEDEYITAKTIASFLSKMEYEIVGIALNITEAITYLKNEIIDCVILDINVNDDKDGVWLGNYIQDNYHIPFVYLTAYTDSETIAKAMRTSPYGFLSKPFQKTELFTAIEIALMKHNNLLNVTHQLKEEEKSLSDFIFLKNIDRFDKVLFKNINFIESQKNYLLVHTIDKVYKHRATIKEFIKVLPDKTFIQVHRAFIVSVDKIQSYNKAEMELEINQNIIPISKSYKTDLLSTLY